MLELLFMLCLLGVFGKLLVFGIRATWGIAKILFTIVFLPVVLLALVFSGLLYVAFPVLVVIGIVAMVATR